MEEFDTRKYEKLKKRDKFLTTWVIYFLFAVDIVLMILLLKTDLYIQLLLIWLPLLGVNTIIKYVGTGFVLSKKSIDTLKCYYHTMPESDVTMYQLNDAIIKCKNAAEKFYLQCLLAELAAGRGEIQNAEQIIYSADISIFEKNPKMAIPYFTVIIEIYDQAEDFDSVKRAYADGEVYFEKYADKNSEMYTLFLSSRIKFNMAYGNYGEAERLADFYLNIIELPKKTSAEYQNLMYGSQLAMAAECSYRNNNISAAAERCKNALALLPAGTYNAYKAEQLMEKINAVSQTV